MSLHIQYIEGYSEKSGDKCSLSEDLHLTYYRLTNMSSSPAGLIVNSKLLVAATLDFFLRSVPSIILDVSAPFHVMSPLKLLT